MPKQTLEPMHPKDFVPWYGKIAAKLVLSRVPAAYGLWRSLSMFRHGSMHKPDYALDTFRQHFKKSKLKGRKDLVHMEFGPGDSLFSSLVSRAHGASKVYLMDVGRFAVDDLDEYSAMHEFLRHVRLPVPDTDFTGDLDSMLASINAEYHTDGLDSLRNVPDNSVDYIWSNAVLEHVRLDEFPETARHMKRLLRPGGVCCHRIDIRDHLDEALNSLRFPKSVWESRVMANSGFYTNRMRRDMIVDCFREAGFEVEVTREVRWDSMPTARWKLHADYRGRSEDELLVAGFDVRLTHPS